MTIKKYVQENNIDVREWTVEAVDRRRLPGFVFDSDSEYRREFIATYGSMEMRGAYCDEYGNKIFEV